MRRQAPARRNALSLVHSLGKTRIEFLGAEINSWGRIYVPKEKARLFEAELAFRLKNLPAERKRPFISHSKFALHVQPHAKRGLHYYDKDDIARSIAAFTRYWKELEAVNYKSAVNNLPYMTFICEDEDDSPPPPWVAYLGGVLDSRQEARSGCLLGGVTSNGSEQTICYLSLEDVEQAWEASKLVEPGNQIQEEEDADMESLMGMSEASFDRLVATCSRQVEGSHAPSLSARSHRGEGAGASEEQTELSVGLNAPLHSLERALGCFDEKEAKCLETGACFDPSRSSYGEELKSVERGSEALVDKVRSLRSELEGKMEAKTSIPLRLGRSEERRSDLPRSLQADEALGEEGEEESYLSAMALYDSDSDGSDRNFRFPPGSPDFDTNSVEGWSDPAPSPRPVTPEGKALRMQEVYIAILPDPSRRWCQRKHPAIRT